MRFNHSIINEFFKYGLVGIVNTSVSLIIIWSLVNCLDVNDLIANPVGYLFGVMSSYILNKNWTFRVKGNDHVVKTSLSFIIIFVVCFVFQYFILWALLRLQILSGFVNQLISMVVFAILNFGLNRQITFKKNNL